MLRVEQQVLALKPLCKHVDTIDVNVVTLAVLDTQALHLFHLCDTNSVVLLEADVLRPVSSHHTSVFWSLASCGRPHSLTSYCMPSWILDTVRAKLGCRCFGVCSTSLSDCLCGRKRSKQDRLFQADGCKQLGRTMCQRRLLGSTA